jgi:hypothetical protein
MSWKADNGGKKGDELVTALYPIRSRAIASEITDKFRRSRVFLQDVYSKIFESAGKRTTAGERAMSLQQHFTQLGQGPSISEITDKFRRSQVFLQDSLQFSNQLKSRQRRAMSL